MPEKIAVKSNKIWYNKEFIKGNLLIENGTIIEVTKTSIPDSFSGNIIDALEKIILPGFIDLHIHGGGGYAVKPGHEEIQKLKKFLAYRGVTAFYPTIGTIEITTLKDTLKTIRNLKKKNKEGAEILGVHLEGPFLSKEEKGAMPEEYILESSIDKMKELEEAGQGVIKRVTVAPELNKSRELIEYLSDKGYTVAAGHTDGSYEEVKKGIDAGISVANHMYNAMRGLHHRRPGAVGAFLSEDKVTCEIIGDGIHVHPAVIFLTYRAKGIKRIYLISDAIIAGGLKAGEYEFGGRTIYINEEGISRLEDGTIAGSTAFMLEGFKNLISKANIPFKHAVQMASENPARVAGVFDRKGSIKKGKDADLLIMDENWELEKTIVKGKVFEI